MKTIIAIAVAIGLCSLPKLASAGTPITDAMTEKYFANCVASAKTEGTMTPDTQNRYCACTAMNMQKSMSQENLVALSNKDKSARLSLNKILIDVNGPCMQYPVHDMLNKKCMVDLNNVSICGCVARNMGHFMADISKRMLPELLADNPDLYDPMTPIMESPEFKQTEQQIALSCATNPNKK